MRKQSGRDVSLASLPCALPLVLSSVVSSTVAMSLFVVIFLNLHSSTSSCLFNFSQHNSDQLSESLHLLFDTATISGRREIDRAADLYRQIRPSRQRLGQSISKV